MSDWTDTDWGATDPAGAWQHKYEMAADAIKSLRARLAGLKEEYIEQEKLLLTAQARLDEALKANDELNAECMRLNASKEDARLYMRLAEADALLQDETVGLPYWCERRDAYLSRKEK